MKRLWQPLTSKRNDLRNQLTKSLDFDEIIKSVKNHMWVDSKIKTFLIDNDL